MRRFGKLLLAAVIVAVALRAPASPPPAPASSAVSAVQHATHAGQVQCEQRSATTARCVASVRGGFGDVDVVRDESGRWRIEP